MDNKNVFYINLKMVSALNYQMVHFNQISVISKISDQV